MNNNSIFIQQPAHRPAQDSDDLELLIVLSKSSLSYLVRDAKSLNSLALFDAQGLPSPHETLENELQGREILKNRFSVVKLCVASGESLLIPEAVYEDPENWASNFIMENTGTSLTKTQAYQDITAMVEIPDTMKNLLNNAGLSNIEYLHPIAAFGGKDIGDGLYIHFTSDHAFFALFQGGTLQFQNAFDLATADEFNYFILLIQDQLSLNQNVEVILSGLINQEDEIYARLNRYFAHIKFDDADNGGVASLLDERLPLHYFTLLSRLASCGS